MYTQECEKLIQMEVEHLSVALLGANYFNLSPELRWWLRACAIEVLRPDVRYQGFIAAA